MSTTSPRLPFRANWDMTYACQLRCTHCYSESGRRAARKLSRADMLRVADVLGALPLRSVHLSGGEPLLIPELDEVVRHLGAHGVPVAVYTNGLLLSDERLAQLAPLLCAVHVSLDGGTAAVHDEVRGRQGSFEGALRALEALERYSAARRERGEAPFTFGVEYTVVRRNFADVEVLLREVLPRFPELGFVAFGSAVPSGLASRERYAREELLTGEQLEQLRGAAFTERLRALVPPRVELSVTDGFMLRMHPEDVRAGTAASGVLHVEPTGRVRAMAIYEGTVGSLLEEPLEELWRRACERHLDPVVTQALGGAHTLEAWAEATRALDLHFGAPEDQPRIQRRASAR